MLERALDEPPPRLERSIATEVGLVEDAPLYRTLRPDTSEDAFRARVATGALCFGAHVSGRLTSVTWARAGGGRISYLDRNLVLSPGDVYLFDTFTRADQRGARLAPAAAAAQIEHFRGAGKERITALVLPENRASLRARARTGFRVSGVIGWIGLGDRRWHFQRPSRRTIP